MLSGIRPREELKKYGIKVISDLSVGKNLQDHVSVFGLVAALNSTSTNKNIFKEEEDITYYEKTHRGPLSGAGSASCSVFLQTIFEHENNVPDIQILFLGVNKEDFLNDPEELFEIDVEPFSYYNAIHIFSILLSPKSKGFIILNESDPLWGAPLIYSGYFTRNSDLDVLTEGVEAALKLFDTESFKKNDFRLIDKPLPACRQFEFGGRDYWKCLMMEYTNTFYHPLAR